MLLSDNELLTLSVFVKLWVTLSFDNPPKEDWPGVASASSDQIQQLRLLKRTYYASFHEILVAAGQIVGTRFEHIFNNLLRCSGKKGLLWFHPEWKVLIIMSLIDHLKILTTLVPCLVEKSIDFVFWWGERWARTLGAFTPSTFPRNSSRNLVQRNSLVPELSSTGAPKVGVARWLQIQN